MSLSTELKNMLSSRGAQLVAFGSMSGVERCSYPVGICVALAVPLEILDEIKDGPTLSYLEMYRTWNARLNEIVTAGEEFLKSRGFSAYAQTTDRCVIDGNARTPLPHKTVATRAGMGWIGKSNLLVTPEFGSAIRISSLLTDAPLDCAEAITQSRCGTCDICQKECPAGALRGTLWQAGTPRDDMVDVSSCRETQTQLMLARTGLDIDLCGKCFVVCPYTKNRFDSKRT